MAYTTIDDPSAYFKVQLYTGNASTQSITYNDTDTTMQPDFLWIKCRGAAENNIVSDIIQGDATGRSGLASLVVNGSTASDNGAGNTYVSSFDSNGFSLGNNDQVNVAQPFVSWGWKESVTAGFDLVGYTGDGNTSKDVSHSLSAVPHLMILKGDSRADGWQVYHHKNTSAPETDMLELNQTSATLDRDTRWNDTAPTSSVFTVGITSNTNTETFIGYLWTEKQGFSKFGSFEGNFNADGSYIHLGFSPSFFLWKNIDSAGSWIIVDNKRPGMNVINDSLNTNNANVENTVTVCDFTSNGVKFRTSADHMNGSYTFVYMAFAEAPFVNSNGVPCNAR